MKTSNALISLMDTPQIILQVVLTFIAVAMAVLARKTLLTRNCELQARRQVQYASALV